MQIAPPAILTSLVKHFLVLENDSPALQHHRLSPDGHAGMVFYYKARFSAFSNTGPVHPRSFVYGQISQFHDLASGGAIGMLVVVLQPYALQTLTGVPAHTFTDQLISLPDIFGAAGQQLEESIVLAENDQQRLQLVQHFLIQKLQQHPAAGRLLTAAMAHIQQQHGLMQVGQLTQALHISERQLERQFRAHVGLTPKQFLRTMRFQHLLKCIQQAPEASLTQLAYETGYYDQAHFIHEFKQLAGITPTQYLTQTRLLAINFMQLPA